MNIRFFFAFVFLSFFAQTAFSQSCNSYMENKVIEKGRQMAAADGRFCLAAVDEDQTEQYFENCSQNTAKKLKRLLTRVAPRICRSACPGLDCRAARKGFLALKEKLMNFKTHTRHVAQLPEKKVDLSR